jgi:hypothetical protein
MFCFASMTEPWCRSLLLQGKGKIPCWCTGSSWLSTYNTIKCNLVVECSVRHTLSPHQLHMRRLFVLIQMPLPQSCEDLEYMWMAFLQNLIETWSFRAKNVLSRINIEVSIEQWSHFQCGTCCSLMQNESNVFEFGFPVTNSVTHSSCNIVRLLKYR